MVAGTTDTSNDEFEALAALEEALADNGKRKSPIKKRIAQLRRWRARDMSYTELVAGGDGHSSCSLTESSTALDSCGASVRRAEAKASTPRA